MQKQQGCTPQNSDCQRSTTDQCATGNGKKKKGVHDKMDEGKSLSHQYSDDSTYTSEKRVCRFLHLPSNRDITEVAEGSAQQAWCEPGVCRFPPSVENRGSVGFAEASHHSPNQLEKRARLPHFHADRSKIVLAEGSNEKGHSPIQYNRIPTVVKKIQSDPPHQYGGASHQPQGLEHPHTAVGQP